MKKNKFPFINIAVMITSLVIFLLFLEAAVRMFIPQRTENFINLYVADNEFGWRLKHNSHGIFKAPEFKVEVAANENGFRDISHDYFKPKDTFRIVGIGDSFLFGYGINREDSILSVLQKLLSKENPPNKKTETINFGIPGYNTNQYYRILQSEAAKYKPDLVILFFYNNDWVTGGSFEFSGGVNKDGFLVSGDKYSSKSIRSFLYPIRSFLKSNSQLFIFVRSRMINLLRKMHLMSIPDIGFYKKDSNFDNKYLYTFELIHKMNEICKQNLSCAFILCIIPDRFQVDKTYRDSVVKSNNINPNDYRWSQPQEALRNFCLRNSINFIDLMPVFSVLELRDKYYFNIDPHWNAKGHYAAAEELFKYINLNLQKSSLK